MDPPRDDAAARREGLERWAQEQQRRLDRRTAPVRLRTRLVARLVRASGLARGARFADRVLERFSDRLFDRGLDTSGQVHVQEHDHRDRVLYVPSAWHVLPRALRYLGVSDDDTFVDFGCGKGRVVHQAARRPFRRVIGVEVSPELADIARTSLAARRRRHRCRDVEIVVSDVTQFRVPDDLTIAYLFRPFSSEVLGAVLQGIVESIDRHPRRVRLIYVWPTRSARSTILATARFRLLKEQSSSLLNPRADRVAIFESR